LLSPPDTGCMSILSCPLGWQMLLHTSCIWWIGTHAWVRQVYGGFHQWYPHLFSEWRRACRASESCLNSIAWP
jgi:hypothetical protein